MYDLGSFIETKEKPSNCWYLTFNGDQFRGIYSQLPSYGNVYCLPKSGLNTYFYFKDKTLTQSSIIYETLEEVNYPGFSSNEILNNIPEFPDYFLKPKIFVPPNKIKYSQDSRLSSV